MKKSTLTAMAILFVMLFLVFPACKMEKAEIEAPGTSGESIPRNLVYGLCLGPYVAGQDPNYGAFVSPEQIRERLRHISRYASWIRTYGMSNGLEEIPRIAKDEFGLRVAAGAWLSDDLSANEREIEKLISIGNSGCAEVLIVGSETILRGELTAEQIIEYVRRVTSAVPDHLEITYADDIQILINHPEILEECDLLFPNVYPYWNGIPIDRAVEYVHVMYQRLKEVGRNRPIVVSETGWPSEGNSVGLANASKSNACFYFLNFQTWAKAQQVNAFYFEAFDEPWKANYEGPQGAHWGVFEEDGSIKDCMRDVFDGATIEPNWNCSTVVGNLGVPMIEFTFVPDIGSQERVEGKVWEVVPAEYKIALYIKVGRGWWNKPYFSQPLTSIDCGGTWNQKYATGGNDVNASEMKVYLLPKGYDPPLLAGVAVLPQELEDMGIAVAHVVR